MSNPIKESLWDAIWREDLEEVRHLLKPGTDFSLQASNGHTLLMQAAEMENIEIAELLISQGADINCQGHNGATPLHIAVDVSIDGNIQNGGEPGDEPTDFILFLLNNGASPDLEDDNGKSSIDWAVSYNSKKVISVLNNANS